jgi:glycosyltransferase involved in cell wall biosynthesis
VFQRPQHLLSRFAKEARVFYFEEPVWSDDGPRLTLRLDDGVRVVVPHLPPALSPEEQAAAQKALLDDVLRAYHVQRYISWYYTPMALAFTRHLVPEVTVFDCMDELAAFAGAPAALKEREAELLVRSDLVFTGGQSLYEAKRGRHPNVYAFPSSVDVPHFGRARTIERDPDDQAPIPAPRLGYFGVIDERMDLDLIRGIAESRPDWQLVLVGPTAKVDPADLPRRPNIHYLGMKTYEELPSYVAGWDVALLPFAMNDATRFISPTKTPEYLAAGRPVVSTPVRDVVRPYGKRGLVRIASTAEEFVSAAEQAMAEDAAVRLARVDEFLADMSWDRTFARMRQLLDSALVTRGEIAIESEQELAAG